MSNSPKPNSPTNKDIDPIQPIVNPIPSIIDPIPPIVNAIPPIVNPIPPIIDPIPPIIDPIPSIIDPIQPIVNPIPPIVNPIPPIIDPIPPIVNPIPPIVNPIPPIVNPIPPIVNPIPPIVNPIPPIIDLSSSYVHFDMSSTTTDISFIAIDMRNTTFNIDISNSLANFAADCSVNSIDISFVNGIEIITETGIKQDGTEVIQILAFTTDPSSEIQIIEKLNTQIEIYDDETDPEINSIIQEISQYASKINCSDFQGKGTINDYAELFKVASNLAQEAKQTTLEIDIAGFNEFGDAADELSKLFQQYIVKLENMNIINDKNFLKSISVSLKKIWNLSETFGKFKQTILGTSIIKVPKSIKDTRVVIEDVMTDVDCAMKYIHHFISPETDISCNNLCGNAELSIEEKEMIEESIHTIQNWDQLYNKGMKIAISENSDVKFIEEANAIMNNTSKLLKDATSVFKGKLTIYKKK